MKRAIFAFLAVTVVASGSGCCCLDRLFCWGCNGCAYGNAGPCGSGGCGACGYGGSGCGCADCGCAGGSVAGASGYAQNGGDGGGPMVAQRGGRAMNGNGYYNQGPMMADGGHPAQGHPFVKQRRDSDDTYEFAAGPPTGATTYPYYTNRGPRDYLARNPRSIGP